MKSPLRRTSLFHRSLLGASLLLACTLAGCGEAPDLPEVTPTTGQRVALPQLRFDRWVDFLTLQAAVDEDCRFMWPVVDDNSVPFPPLQGMWVIYENPNDVTDGREVRGTYFDGDTLPVDSFPRLEDLDPLGFKFTTPLQQSFLKIDATDLRRDGTELWADFGAPIKAVLRMSAGPHPDAGLPVDAAAPEGEVFPACQVLTDVCDAPGDGTDEGPCEALAQAQAPGATWRPVHHVDMTLGLILNVTSVTFEEEEDPELVE